MIRLELFKKILFVTIDKFSPRQSPVTDFKVRRKQTRPQCANNTLEAFDYITYTNIIQKPEIHYNTNA